MFEFNPGPISCPRSAPPPIHRAHWVAHGACVIVCALNLILTEFNCVVCWFFPFLHSSDDDTQIYAPPLQATKHPRHYRDNDPHKLQCIIKYSQILKLLKRKLPLLLLSSSLLLFLQHFGRYVLRPSSGVCQTWEPTRNFELRPLLNPQGSPVLILCRFPSSTNTRRRPEGISAETLWK